MIVKDHILLTKLFQGILTALAIFSHIAQLKAGSFQFNACFLLFMFMLNLWFIGTSAQIWMLSNSSEDIIARFISVMNSEKRDFMIYAIKYDPVINKLVNLSWFLIGIPMVILLVKGIYDNHTDLFAGNFWVSFMPLIVYTAAISVLMDVCILRIIFIKRKIFPKVKR